jgi:hypothetical protein
MPTKHEAYANPWMTTNIFKNCLMQLNAKLGAKITKILLFIAQPKNTIFLRNIKNIFFPANCIGQLQTLDLGIIHVLKCHYKKQLIWKTVAKMERETTPRCCAYENRCVPAGC